MNRLRTFDPALLMRILSISCFTMLQYFLSMATWFVFFVAVERLGQRNRRLPISSGVFMSYC